MRTRKAGIEKTPISIGYTAVILSQLSKHYGLVEPSLAQWRVTSCAHRNTFPPRLAQTTLQARNVRTYSAFSRDDKLFAAPIITDGIAKAVREELAPDFKKIHRKLPAVEKQKKIHNKRVKRLREVGRANKGKRRVSVVKIRQTIKELLPSHNAKRTAAKVATATKLSISVSTVERGLRRRKSPA